MTFVLFLYLLLVCFVFGILPTLGVLNRLAVPERQALGFSIALTLPVLAAQLFVLHAIGVWGSLAVTVIAIGLLRPDRVLRNLSRETLTALGLGAALGLHLWYFFYRPFYLNGYVYNDTFWNIAIVSEMTRQFPPQYPMWIDSGGPFIYHYLPNMAWATLQMISQVDLFQVILHFGTLFIWLSFGSVFALTSSHQRLSRNVIFAAFLGFYFLNMEWPPILGLQFHLSSAISNFFWGLPLMYGGIMIWRYMEKKRLHQALQGRTSMAYLSGLTIGLLTLTTAFLKGSTALLIVTLEFFSFLIASYRLLKLKRTTVWLKSLFSFSFAPAAFFFVFWLMSNNIGVSVFKKVARDKFENVLVQNYTSLYLLFFGLMLLMVFLRRPNSLQISLVGASVLNFLIYVLVTHHSHSEIYFIFNVVVIYIAFLASLNWSSAYRTVAPALVALILFNMATSGTKSEVQPFARAVVARDIKLPGLTMKSEDFRELRSLAPLVPPGSIVAAPDANCREIQYAAALESRVWAECSYDPTVIDPTKLQNLQREFVFSPDMDATQCRQIQSQHGITHALVRMQDVGVISRCIKNAPKKFWGGHYALFSLVSD